LGPLREWHWVPWTPVKKCYASASRLVPKLLRSAVVGAGAPALQSVLSSPVFVSFPRCGSLVAGALAAEKPPAKLQRLLCDVPAAAAAALRTTKAASNKLEAARLLSVTASGVTDAFCPPPGHDDEVWWRLPVLWADRGVFLSALRMRLGLPNLPVDSPCSFCGRAPATNSDDHAVNCIRGGGRQRAHTSLKHAVFSAASAANWGPRLETCPFRDDSGRVDVECAWGGQRFAIDVSIVSVGPSLTAACAAAGGAATKHEATKLTRYGPAAAATDSALKVVPLIWDTFGAAGSTASSFRSSSGTRCGFAVWFDSWQDYLVPSISLGVARHFRHR